MAFDNQEGTMNQVGKWLLAGMVLVGQARPVGAVGAPCQGSCSVNVTADVPSALSFNVTITELLNNGTVIGPPVTAMDFGNLASNGMFDPDGGGPLPSQLRSLNSTRAYQVFFGINAQQRPFTIKQTAGPLQSGPNSLKDGAFIVTPLSGVGGDPSKPLPAGTTPGSQGTAVQTDKVLFTGTGGASDTMAATYGITDDPRLGAFQFIPLDQPAGNYITTVTYTATVT